MRLSRVGQEMGATSRKGLTYQDCVMFAESNSTRGVHVLSIYGCLKRLQIRHFTH